MVIDHGTPVVNFLNFFHALFKSLLQDPILMVKSQAISPFAGIHNELPPKFSGKSEGLFRKQTPIKEARR